jgi:hypothetical protein
MPLPSEVSSIINATRNAGVDLLKTLADRGKSAGAAGVAALNGWLRRMEEVGARFAQGKLAAADFKKICESESEALKFNLAAIANEQARAALNDLLRASFSFLGQILGAVG